MTGTPVFCRRFTTIGDVHEHVAAIVFDAETADPAIEDLNGIGPGAHLLGRVLAVVTATSLPMSSFHAAGCEYIIFLCARSCASRRLRSCSWPA